MIQRFVRENANAQVVRLDLLLRLLNRMCEATIGRQEESTAHTLLFASMLKVQQSGKAVRLIAEALCVEEIQAIGRTLVEVIVNAAYFQYAGQAEIAKYLRFSPKVAQQQLGASKQRRGYALLAGITQKLGQLGLKNVSLVAASNVDPVWTARPLIDRAQLSDEASDIPVMARLVARSNGKGDAAVHGTVEALENFIAALDPSGPPQSENRLHALSEALFSVNLSLLTFCIYLNSFFHLGMDEAIDEAANADSTTRPSLQGE